MSINVCKTSKELSSFAGLKIASDLMAQTKLANLVDASMPRLASGSGRSIMKFRGLVLGLVAGAECLDDMAELAKDGVMAELCGGSVYTPKSYGDFLRSFSLAQVRKLQGSLLSFAFAARRQSHPGEHRFVFDIDSTPNPQHGLKIEGVRKNYEGVDCLDTLDAFDQFGYQYSVDVRAGGTHTAKGSEIVVYNLMKEFRYHKETFDNKAYCVFRADAGYYTSGFINACKAAGADLVVRVREHRQQFPKILGQVHDWRKPKECGGKRILFYDGRECEIGTTNYRPEDVSRRLRYVIIRAKKPASPLFPDHVEYDYFAFCTTLSEEKMSAEEVIFFYRKRGHAENFIRENKNGFDLRHYPCLKLDANRAYATIAAFAYNLMRLLAFLDNKDKPHFAKKIRFKWIRLPCTVARTCRKTVFRYMNHHYKEICHWTEKIQLLKFRYG